MYWLNPVSQTCPDNCSCNLLKPDALTPSHSNSIVPRLPRISFEPPSYTSAPKRLPSVSAHSFMDDPDPEMFGPLVAITAESLVLLASNIANRCMNFIPGKPVSEVWFDDSGTLPREDLRLRILTSLSRTMAQFSCLTLDKMGSIMEDGSGSTVIGPLYDWHEKEDSRLQVAVSGPFDSTSAFLQEILIASSNKDIRGKAEAKCWKPL